MRLAILASVAAAALACSPEQGDRSPGPSQTGEPPNPAGSPPSEQPASEKLVRRGRSVYNQICIACHASEPSLAGNVGPPIAGSPLTLLQAKVLRNAYPPGYTPKRDTLNMVPLPHVEKDLPALAAFLGSVAE